VALRSINEILTLVVAAYTSWGRACNTTEYITFGAGHVSCNIYRLYLAVVKATAGTEPHSKELRSITTKVEGILFFVKVASVTRLTTTDTSTNANLITTNTTSTTTTATMTTTTT
jgi:hypothetical protein